MQLPSKPLLRQALRRARKSLPQAERQRATRTINHQLKPIIKRGGRIAVYWPIGSELRLDDFIRAALQRHAKVYLPYIEPHRLRLWFTPYQANARHSERKRGHRQLDIPQFSGKKIRAHQLSHMILPLVGIDQHGYRLGQGGGYYDATLAACTHRLRPALIGVGFACQQCNQLPIEPHDARLNAFVSEHGWQFFQKGRLK